MLRRVGGLLVVVLLSAACSAPVAPAAIPARLTAETARFEVPAAPGPVKPFRGESTQQVQVVDGYATMLFTLRNVGEEPVTFLNSLYDYEPKQLYEPMVRMDWKDGETAFGTRQGRFFPSPAVLQPGAEAVYLMGGIKVDGTGEIGSLDTHIKYCPTRGMDDVPSVPLEVSDLSWETRDGLTTVRGTVREPNGVRRYHAPAIGVAFFDAQGDFAGAVVDGSAAEPLNDGRPHTFEISGRGVRADAIASATGYAWMR
jgi:hypothetical protein